MRAWLLTYDRGLTSFAVRRADPSHFAPCILGDSWLQITRPFLPRTKEYEEAFFAMLQHPLLMRGMDAIPFEHVTDALSRLERYRELPAPLVAAMVADGEFHRRLSDARDEETEKRVVEVTVQRLAEAATQRAEKAEGELATALSRIEGLEASVTQIEVEKAHVTGTAAEERHLAKTREEELAAELRRVPDQVEAAVNKAVDTARAHSDAAIQRMSWRMLNAILWLSYVFCLVVVTLIIGLSIIIMPTNPITIGIAVGWWAVTAVCLLAIPFHKKLGTILTAAGLIVALLSSIGLTYQLLSAAGTGADADAPAELEIR